MEIKVMSSKEHQIEELTNAIVNLQKEKIDIQLNYAILQEKYLRELGETGRSWEDDKDLEYAQLNIKYLSVLRGNT